MLQGSGRKLQLPRSMSPRNGIFTQFDSVWIKKVLNCTGNTIYLTESTDTEQDLHIHQRMQKSLQAISISLPYLFQYNRKVRQGCDHLLLPHGILLPEDLLNISLPFQRMLQAIIQNNAPGPPAQTAVATPTILPVPIVALSAVHNAAKLEISPSPSSSFLNIHFSASGSLLHLKNAQVVTVSKNTTCHDQGHQGALPRRDRLQ